MRLTTLGVGILGLWLLLSGHYTPLMLGFALASTVLVVYVAERMRRFRGIEDRSITPGFLGRLALYAPWLVKEVVVSNIAVARIVLSPSLPIRPSVLRFRRTPTSDLVRVVYANSITLTPGTVTIDVRGSELDVHALVGTDLEQHEETDMLRMMDWLEGS